MKRYLIPENGQFYKANLHTHTTVSDGCKTPEQIKEIYKAHGYSVIAFTDHEVMVDHSDLNDESFLAITSYEVNTSGPALYGDFGEYPCYHLNFYAKAPHETNYPCPNPDYTWGNARAYAEKQDYYKGDHRRVYSTEAQNDMIAEALSKGYLVSYNHPNWSKQPHDHYIGLEGLTALEVYNTGCAVGGWSLDESDHVLDEFLMAGKQVYPVATDDNHDAYGFEGVKTDSFGGWTMIAAEKLGYTEIMDALEAGDFYASTGPEIYSITLDDSLEESVIRVECSPAKAIYLITQGRRNSRALPEGEERLITSGAMKLYPQDARFRIRVDDENGNSAWSRIYDIPEDAPRVVVKN